MAQEIVEFIPNNIYHVYTHANGSDNLFRADLDFNIFLQKYQKYLNKVAETYAYCLMPNHFHFMLKIKNEQEILKSDSYYKNVLERKSFSNMISTQFSHLLNSHTQWHNKRYERIGSLFKPNIKRNIVKNKNQMLQLFAYIHNNPVHHRFCKSPLEWPHSSIHAYFQNRSSKLNKDFMEHWFKNRGTLLSFHKEMIGKIPLEMTF